MWVSDGPLYWGDREPLRPAVISGPTVLTYGMLRERVLNLAPAIRTRLGADVQRPVALQCGDPVEFLVTFLAIVEAGAIAVPLAADWTETELDAAFSSCPWALAIDGAGGARGPRLALRDDDLATTAAPGSGHRGSELLFYAGFSSGSTGRPKAIVRSHRAWLMSFLAMGVEFGLSAGSRIAVPGSLYFSFSLIAALQALYAGASVYVPHGNDAPTNLDLFDQPFDTAYILPSLLTTVLNRASHLERRFPHVRQLICAGEQLRPETRRRATETFSSAAVREYYGASELGFVTVIDDAGAEAHPGSVGRPFLGTEVAIRRESGERQAVGAVGFVYARTEYGMSGYFADPGRSSNDRDGWRTVGDLGRVDGDGYLSLAGRADQMIVIRGENIYPEEVERVVLSIPGIHEVAVAADDPDHPRALVAFVVTGGERDARAVLNACASRLHPRAVPRRVEFVDALPHTPTGKIARDQLPRLDAGSSST